MPTPLGDTFPHTVIQSPSGSDQPILPLHVATKHQIIHQQQLRQSTEEGIELDTIQETARPLDEEFIAQDRQSPSKPPRPRVDTATQPEDSHLLSDDELSSPFSPTSPHMPPRTRPLKRKSAGRT